MRPPSKRLKGNKAGDTPLTVEQDEALDEIIIQDVRFRRIIFWMLATEKVGKGSKCFRLVRLEDGVLTLELCEDHGEKKK